MAQYDVQISINGLEVTANPTEIAFQTGDSVTLSADAHGATLLASEEAISILSPAPYFETDIAPNGSVSFSFLSASPGKYMVVVQAPDCPFHTIDDGSSSGGSAAVLEIVARWGGKSDPDPIVVDPPSLN